MELVKSDFENFHNHASEAVSYFFRLILSVLIIMFDGLYRAAKYLREYTYTKVSIPANHAPAKRASDSINSWYIHSQTQEAVTNIPEIFRDFWPNRIDEGIYEPVWIAHHGNEMLQEETILSDKPAKGRIRKWLKVQMSIAEDLQKQLVTTQLLEGSYSLNTPLDQNLNRMPYVLKQELEPA